MKSKLIKIKLAAISAALLCASLPSQAENNLYGANRARRIDDSQGTMTLFGAPTPSKTITDTITPSGPSGMYCGRAAVYTDNMAITDRVACDGHLVAYTAYSQAYMPPQAAYCTGNDNPECFPASPGYYYNTSYFATDCPSGYRVTTTGSSGPYQYYACIKS